MTETLALLEPAHPVAPTSIAGSFRTAGTSPDGDSVRFVPDDPGVWRRLGIRARVNAAGGVQLRLDAIDALETHFATTGSRSSWHQPPRLAVAATEALLHTLGFTSFRRAEDTGTISDPHPDSTPGWIVTSGADVNGRPIAFVRGGVRSAAGPEWSADRADGPVELTPAMVATTVNDAQLRDGLAYPTFYAGLADGVRNALAGTARRARESGLGVWADDVTNGGFEVTGRRQLEEAVTLLPKLFRRLAEYLSAAGGAVSLAGLTDFLAVSADAVRVLPDGRVSTLAELVEVDGQRVRLTVPPERLVFAEKQTRLVGIAPL